jgi:hypothetical protein
LIRQEDAAATLASPSFRRVDRATMSSRWTKPAAGLPDRYIRLAYLAYSKGRISIARLAEFLETSISELATQDLERERAEETEAAAA